MADDRPHASPAGEDPRDVDRVPCPNCCRLAFVVRREMGLDHYRCELCLAEGALPSRDDEPRG